ncbi:RhuM family protein [Fibrobacter sp.]|uniref:RhuM family protein n=1 Tax=Fibrobacter sp. TaxID=35828 RepID=UPI00386991DD
MSKNSRKINPVSIRSSAAEYLTYVAAVGGSEQSVEMRYEDENVWLTQKMMAELYGVSVPAINQHIKNILEDGELTEDSVIKKYLITAADGKNYQANHYNLQMIIAVGFKVNNERAVQFRKWAGQIVKDYTIQGWVMDKERLKNFGTILTEDYFERQLEAIREIRVSERRFYQKVTDIYSTALDYDPSAKITRDFFKKVQNKLHWAIHGQELKALELIVSGYLDFAEMQAARHIPMTMEDWARHLDRILEATEHELLTNAGKISMEVAQTHAITEWEKYRVVQDKLFHSDFDYFLELHEKMAQYKA